MGVGMLRRYHTQAPEHVNEPGDVEASEEAQEVTETPRPVDTEAGGEPAGTVEGDNVAVPPPAGNASQADWADWVIANVEGVDEDTVRAMSRNELREKYGPKAE